MLYGCACADASTLALVAQKTSAHSDVVHSVGFSPDGTRIVSGSGDSSMKVWGARRSLAVSCRALLVAVGVWEAAEACVCACDSQMLRRWRW